MVPRPLAAAQAMTSCTCADVIQPEKPCRPTIERDMGETYPIMP